MRRPRPTRRSPPASTCSCSATASRWPTRSRSSGGPTARGLLLMGPECGTSLVDGVGLGFANRVRRGRVGLVAASGTGLQEVASLVHRLGAGVSQGIGTGGRDLHEAWAGSRRSRRCPGWRRDPETHVIGLVSKAPSPGVAARVLAAAARVGQARRRLPAGWRGAAPTGVLSVATLEAAALGVRAGARAEGAGFPREHQGPARPRAGPRAGPLHGRHALRGGAGHRRGRRARRSSTSATRSTRAGARIRSSTRGSGTPPSRARAAIAVSAWSWWTSSSATAPIRTRRARSRSRSTRRAHVRAARAGPSRSSRTSSAPTRIPRGWPARNATLRKAGARVCPTNRLAAELARDLVRGRRGR